MNKPLDNEKAPPHIPDSERPGVYFMPSGYQHDDDEISLVDLWLVLVRFRALIIALTFVSTLIAIGYAMTATPVYRAEAVLAPVSEKDGGASSLLGQFGDLAALAGVNVGNGSGDKEQAIAILKSRSFTDKFIRQEKMMPQLFEQQWNADTKTWAGETPDSWDAYKLFNNARSLDEDKKNGLIRLSVEWHNPAQAAIWVNNLVKSINNEMRKTTIRESEKSIAYLQQELNKTSVVDLQQSIHRLIEGQLKNIMLANARDEFAFRVIDPAVIPKDKIRPNKKMIVILGFMVGLIFSVFLAFAWSWFQNIREQAGYYPN